jgi:quinolinate synthase
MKNIEEEIKKLKKERNAVILAHNYQRPEVQDIADFLGDSFGLSLRAIKTDADVIVFCGVDFMAESAAILNPGKIVLHPNVEARCPMAAMVDVKGLKALKKKHPKAAVVSYVNTSASVKAESDICCTSANAVKIVKSVPNDEVIFVPDANLGLYVKRFIKDKKIILWPGYCHVHQDIKKDDILQLKELHPSAKVLVHPECVPEVIDIADAAHSTEGMIKYVAKSDAKEFIIGTEREMAYRLKKEYPNKEFHSLKSALCYNMKKITIENVLWSLQNLETKIKLSDEIIKKAMTPLKKMMKVGRED